MKSRMQQASTADGSATLKNPARVRYAIWLEKGVRGRNFGKVSLPQASIATRNGPPKGTQNTNKNAKP